MNLTIIACFFSSYYILGLDFSISATLIWLHRIVSTLTLRSPAPLNFLSLFNSAYISKSVMTYSTHMSQHSRCLVHGGVSLDGDALYSVLSCESGLLV